MRRIVIVKLQSSITILDREPFVDKNLSRSMGSIHCMHCTKCSYKSIPLLTTKCNISKKKTTWYHSGGSTNKEEGEDEFSTKPRVPIPPNDRAR